MVNNLKAGGTYPRKGKVMSENINAKTLTHTAMMTAVICVLAPMSLKIGPIPISFTNLALLALVSLMGTKKTLAAYGVYYLLGIFGLPVFSGYSGGFQMAVGPTGGFLAGFFALIAISGYFTEKYSNKLMHFAGMTAGECVLYLFGTQWYSLISHTGFADSFKVCVLPFIGIDLLKMIIAIYFASELKKRVKI